MCTPPAEPSPPRAGSLGTRTIEIRICAEFPGTTVASALVARWHARRHRPAPWCWTSLAFKAAFPNAFPTLSLQGYTYTLPATLSPSKPASRASSCGAPPSSLDEPALGGPWRSRRCAGRVADSDSHCKRQFTRAARRPQRPALSRRRLRVHTLWSP